MKIGELALALIADRQAPWRDGPWVTADGPNFATMGRKPIVGIFSVGLKSRIAEGQRAKRRGD
jgi:hypothetical protein